MIGEVVWKNRFVPFGRSFHFAFLRFLNFISPIIFRTSRIISLSPADRQLMAQVGKTPNDDDGYDHNDDDNEDDDDDKKMIMMTMTMRMTAIAYTRKKKRNN